MTVKTSVIQTFLKSYKHDYVPFNNGQRLRIIDSISELSFSKRHHYAAFVRGQGILVVWDENPTEVFDRAEMIQKYVVNMLWSMDDNETDDDEEYEIDDEKYAITTSNRPEVASTD